MKYKVLFTAPYMIPFVDRFKPVFDQYDIELIIPVVHERMEELAKLTPEQRRVTRENFRRAYQLPAEQRQEKLQKYQELPEEKKRELAEVADKKPETPRRTGLPAQPATKAEPKPALKPEQSPQGVTPPPAAPTEPFGGTEIKP